MLKCTKPGLHTSTNFKKAPSSKPALAFAVSLRIVSDYETDTPARPRPYSPLPTPMPAPHRSILLALLSACVLLAAQTPAKPPPDFRGLPYHRFYTSKDFDSSATSTFIASAKDGSIVYGDQNWIFLYDGATWRKIYQNSGSPDKITILAWDDDGAIYAGGFETLGTFGIDESNKYVFRPHADSEGKPLQASGNYSKIITTKSSVYFLGRRCAAILDKSTGAIVSKAFDTWVTASFFHDGRFHLVTDSNDILRFENGAFVPIPGLSYIAKSRDITIAATVAAPNGDVIVGSERRGLYRFDGSTLVPAYPNFAHDKSHLLRDMALTDDGRLILAFLEGGIVVLDDQGNTLETFTDSIDYRFKSARSVMVDDNGALWAMFNSSLAKILLDTPLTAIDERLRPSLFYASPHLQGGDFYLRSFYVLYQAEYDERNRIASFRNALPDIDYEIWSVAEGRDGLYLNTNGQGIFLLRGGELVHQVDSPAFDRLQVLPLAPHLLVGANSATIHLYRKQGGSLALVDSIPNNGAFINRMHPDRHGHLWLEYGLGRAGRVRVEAEKLVLDVFGSDSGLPANEWATIWMHEGEALYTFADQVVALDESSRRFVEKPFLKQAFGGGPLHIARAFTDPQGNIWISANNANLILWKSDDGSYQIDERSLSEMGEPYFEFLVHLPGGQTIIVTALECFFFQPRLSAPNRPPPPTRIISIADAKTAAKHFAYLGDGSLPSPIRLSSQQNSIEFTVANAYSVSTKSTEFQYHLEGFSPHDLPSAAAPWTPSSVATFTNLDHGAYTFKVRASLGDGQITSWTSYPFAIERAPYQSFAAYAAYAAIAIAAILLAIRLYARRLTSQNAKLERIVAERIQEIEVKNLELERQAEILESQNLELANQSEEIQTNATQLKAALRQLEQAQEQLVATARTAGRAEVATNVLHNVGNVLNSVNVSIANLSSLLSRSRVEKLARIAKALKHRQDDLQTYLEDDEKGRHVPEYLEQLAAVLRGELAAVTQEVRYMETNVEHIKKIIATQQTHAKNVGILQSFDLVELLDSAIAITLGDPILANLAITRDFPETLQIETDKHKLLEILINLLKNAQQSIDGFASEHRHIHLAIRRSPDRRQAEVSIADSGGGIAPDSQPKLFTHGFTTRPDGHGFGLHSCANAIKSLGGSIRLESPGLGQGATATLTLPATSPKENVASKTGLQQLPASQKRS